MPYLLAIDLEHRDSAAEALNEAIAMARNRDAELHVAYVLAYGHYSYIQPFLSQEVLDDTIARAHADLDTLIAGADSGDLTVVPHVLRGGVSQQVLLLATRIGATHLIVNARHEHTHGSATGPNAAQMARFATCSVTVLR